MAPGTRQLSDADLDEVLRFAKDLAKRAGELMKRGSTAILSTTGDIAQKASAVDLVTEWDVKVEQLIRAEIDKAWPGFEFIGEESFSAGTDGRPRLTEEPTFCVDPIDGTTNFVHGFPFACVSIGLIYRKEPVVGVIYCPFLDQLYAARRGGGAWLNESQRLPLTPPRPLPSLALALVGVEWGSARAGKAMKAKLASFRELAAQEGKMVHGLRSIGSAAMNYALVASGGLDLYWEIGCWPWDISAGVVIAQEAGAFVSGAAASPHDGVVDDTVLNGRKYIVVRAIADRPNETGRECQKRLIKDFYSAVQEYEP
ncbi:inositol monophosphatase [Auricularia subglabra TFB-10046 SS5]|nr:inositol monophosphatase [Auricularia subglabra TFB-10046 SS5]